MGTLLRRPQCVCGGGGLVPLPLPITSRSPKAFLSQCVAGIPPAGLAAEWKGTPSCQPTVRLSACSLELTLFSLP